MTKTTVLSILLGVILASPGLAGQDFDSEDGETKSLDAYALLKDQFSETVRGKYFFTDPQYDGHLFHASMPAKELCRWLKTGPGGGYIKTKLALSGKAWVWDGKYARVQNQRLFRYISEIACSPPDLELATQLLREELLNKADALAYDRHLIQQLIFLYPNLIRELPAEFHGSSP